MVSIRTTAPLCVIVTFTGAANGALIPRCRKFTFTVNTDGVAWSGLKSALNRPPTVSEHFTRPPKPFVQLAKV